MNSQGLLLCSRYAVAPNFFGYCGPDENASLIDHLKEKTADKEVSNILSQFETLFPYLKLISAENKIADFFDKKVVEAYWIGNNLLDNISNKNYSYLLTEKLDLEKKMGIIKFQKVKAKIMSAKFYPHHAFHVFNIFKRTGHNFSSHTLNTMDECRIGWGKIKKILNSEFRIQNVIEIETQQLTMNNKQLTFTNQIAKEIKINYKGKSFFENLKIGDWVSFHWGFVCDTLTQIQVKNLDFYTKQAINFFNS